MSNGLEAAAERVAAAVERGDLTEDAGRAMLREAALAAAQAPPPPPPPPTVPTVDDERAAAFERINEFEAKQSERAELADYSRKHLIQQGAMQQADSELFSDQECIDWADLDGSRAKAVADHEAEVLASLEDGAEG
jgi:hypothetical protein